MMRVFILILIVSSSFFAQDKLALLIKVTNNTTLHMKYQQTPFLCQPYGVETLDALANRQDVNGSCKQVLQRFRENQPKEKFYAQMLFHVQQQYTVRAVDDRCLLLLSFAHSYSEKLLEKGYARILPTLVYKDELLQYRFLQAVKRAKREKNGIWQDEDFEMCFLLPPK